MTTPSAGWDSAYQDSRPTWDIGRAQPAFTRLADSGLLSGRVLDAGCGTGGLLAVLCKRPGLEPLGIEWDAADKKWKAETVLFVDHDWAHLVTDGTQFLAASSRRVRKVPGKGLVSSGGRVLTAVGMGDDLQTARMAALSGAVRVRFPGAFFRKDIAQLA